MKCPRCQGDLILNWETGVVECKTCGYQPQHQSPIQPAQPPPSPPAPAPSPASADQPPIEIDVPGGMDMNNLPEHLTGYEQVRMRGRLETAMFAFARDDEAEARRALRSALQISEDYADAWIQLAALATNAAEQREFLEHALAAEPTNPLAMTAIAKLDGKDELPELGTQAALDPDQAAIKSLVCPQCGGGLDYDVKTREVSCAFCGYKVLDADNLRDSGGETTLIEGNLRRKKHADVWNIGRQWLRCNTCGATTTLSRSTLSNTCRFCGSRHIVQESVQSRFEQPDLIVPFAVTEEDAHAAIEKALRSGIRAITRFFADAIARVVLSGVYLPFWVFDADLVVNWSWTNAPDRGKHPVLVSNVPYLAADRPSRRLVYKIEPFDIDRAVDYDPRLLARYPAELYTLDMTDASIKARDRLSQLAQRQAEVGLRLRRPSSGYGEDNDAGSLRMNAHTEMLTYRLGLLPVWIGAIVEEDGDVRQVLVNGQTGKAALGKLQKAK